MKRRITVRSAKNKGKSLQNKVCEKISELTGIPWGSEDEMLIQSRQMGQKGCDVILRGKALERFPYSIECKSAQKINLWAAIDQAKANQKKDTDWLVVLKRKEIKSPVVCLDINVFFNILKKGEKQ